MTVDSARERQPPLLHWLADPRSHGIDEPTKRIDTQGAVVILAGAFAYQIRRAIRLPFLDYSTLEKRKAACEAEISLNRAAAPGVYLDAIPIRRAADGFSFGGNGEIVEWATRMRRFDENATFDRLAERGALTPELIDDLARAFRASHVRAPLREGAPAIQSLGRYLDQNREAFTKDADLFAADRAGLLDLRARNALTALTPLLSARAELGYTRRCHGDAHLRNIVALEGKAVLFDAIEFDESIANGDVFYDLAFALMDLVERGCLAHANRLMNRYLADGEERELDGLAALPFFLSLRAAIRAKVVAANAPHLEGEARERESAAARRYFDLALTCLDPAPVRLVAVGGLSGSGKSALSDQLAPCVGGPPGALWLRSDVERKHMFAVAETARLPAAAYDPRVSRATYARMSRKAERALRAGLSVILDAVHAHGAEREDVAALAARPGVPFVGLWLDAPADARVSRVSMRQDDPSDADGAVAAAQRADPLGQAGWVAIDASGTLSASVSAALRALAL